MNNFQSLINKGFPTLFVENKCILKKYNPLLKCLRGHVMFEHNAKQMILPHEFFLPFGGHLNPDNRWVRVASIIPWAELENTYLESLGDPTQGRRDYNVQLALGALIIKERLGLSDEETVETITENAPICNISLDCLRFRKRLLSMPLRLVQTTERLFFTKFAIRIA